MYDLDLSKPYRGQVCVVKTTITTKTGNMYAPDWCSPGWRQVKVRGGACVFYGPIRDEPKGERVELIAPMYVTI